MPGPVLSSQGRSAASGTSPDARDGRQGDAGGQAGVTLVDGRGRRAGWRRLARLCGPGLVVAVAYVDPGNVATNTQAGATLGTRLLFVVLLAGLAAMLVQYLSATLGVATGRSLAEQCRLQYPRAATRGLWVQAEVVTMATDVAEVIGGALALYLLFGVPLPVGGVLVAAVGVGLLLLGTDERNRFQLAVAGLLTVLLTGLAYLVWRLGPGVGETVAGLRPDLSGPGALVLATGIVGATVMPHAVYLHSALTASRPVVGSADAVRAALRGHRREIVVALTVAACANAAFLLIAAGAFHGDGAPIPGVDGGDLEAAHAGLSSYAWPLGAAFAVVLLASGIAASGVGTLAGDVVMQGFLRRRVPLVVRRVVTVAPALVVLWLPVSVTDALVGSQVVLSFGVPFALGPLVHLTASRRVMGTLRVRRSVTVAAGVVAGVISALNLWLILDAL
ncbi:MAG: Nramp family divalent metal transporter [Kineosporiaceae bacterium]